MNTKDQPRDWADVIVEELIDHWIDIDLPLDFEKTIAQALRDVEEKRMRLDAAIVIQTPIVEAESYFEARSRFRDRILSARLGEGE